MPSSFVLSIHPLFPPAPHAKYCVKINSIRMKWKKRKWNKSNKWTTDEWRAVSQMSSSPSSSSSWPSPSSCFYFRSLCVCVCMIVYTHSMKILSVRTSCHSKKLNCPKCSCLIDIHGVSRSNSFTLHRVRIAHYQQQRQKREKNDNNWNNQIQIKYLKLKRQECDTIRLAHIHTHACWRKKVELRKFRNIRRVLLSKDYLNLEESTTLYVQVSDADFYHLLLDQAKR